MPDENVTKTEPELEPETPAEPAPETSAEPEPEPEPEPPRERIASHVAGRTWDDEPAGPNTPPNPPEAG